MAPAAPVAGQVWRHHSGQMYTVLGLANDVVEAKPDYPPTVVYTGENGKMWAGRLDDWHRRMTFWGNVAS